jgi:hypothetical protein
LNPRGAYAPQGFRDLAVQPLRHPSLYPFGSDDQLKADLANRSGPRENRTPACGMQNRCSTTEP